MLVVRHVFYDATSCIFMLLYIFEFVFVYEFRLKLSPLFFFLVANIRCGFFYHKLMYQTHFKVLTFFFRLSTLVDETVSIRSTDGHEHNVIFHLNCSPLFSGCILRIRLPTHFTKSSYLETEANLYVACVLYNVSIVLWLASNSNFRPFSIDGTPCNFPNNVTSSRNKNYTKKILCHRVLDDNESATLRIAYRWNMRQENFCLSCFASLCLSPLTVIKRTICSVFFIEYICFKCLKVVSIRKEFIFFRS